MTPRRRIGLRAVEATDAPVVTALLDELGYPSSVSAVRTRLARLAEDPSTTVLAATLDGDVAGVVSLHVMRTLEHDHPVGVLAALVVAARHRRLGLGMALLGAAEQEARRRGCGRIVLGTAERRTAAHTFYRRAGYVETGRRFARELAAL